MKYLLFTIMLLLISCSDKEVIDDPLSKKCYLLKYGLSFYLSDGTEQFPIELHYEENRIIRRSEYSIVIIANNQKVFSSLSSEKNVFYNEDKLPVKIIETKPSAAGQTEEEILYDGQKRMLNKIKKTKNHSTIETNHATYSYDSQNRISSYIEKIYTNLDSTSHVYTYEIVYNDYGNLESITRTNLKNRVYTYVTTYENYDSYKNPLQNINVPFDDVLLLQYSKNNFRKTKSILYLNNIPTGTGSWHSRDFTEYNENNYPAAWKYRCD